MSDATGRGRSLGRALALLVLLGAVAYGLFAVDTLVAGRRFPRAGAWSDALPLAAAAGLAAVLIAGLLRRAGTAALAAGALGWCFGVHGACDLPAFASTSWFADGPHGAGWLLALGTAAGLFAAAGPRAWRPDERLAAVLVVATTGSANLFSRSGEGVFALLAAGVLLHFGTAPWVASATRRARGPGALAFALAAAFVAWTWLGIAGGEDLSLGYRVGLRVVGGALLAWTLAASLDGRGAARMAWALLAGGAAALVALAIDLAAFADVEPAARVFGSRWRALGMHPNGLGPLLGSTAVLAAALAVRARGAARLACVVLALAAGFALVRTGSRASELGTLLGGAIALAAIALPPLRRARPIALALAALALVATAALLSPLGARLAERLDALAHQPSALGQRWHFWRASVAALAERPWTGLGPNQPFLRTAYAEPSFYSGTPQDLHPHQLFLAIAEGAGWPALALFVALLLVGAELGRRALARAPAGETRPRVARALAAGVFGYALAILAANQLDLGLSQNTFAPLWLWIALALLAVLARADAVPLAPSRLRAACALVLLVPLALHPGALATLHARGEAHADAGREERARVLAGRLERLSPGDARAHVLAMRADRLLGRERDVLERRRARAAASPRRASAWHALVDEALAQRDLALAAEAARRAHALDPEGPRAGDHLALDGALAFARGDIDAGRELVLGALLAGSDALARTPFVALPPMEGDPAGARRRGFAVAGGAEAVPWNDVLDEALDAACARATSDPVGSRRLVRPVLDAYVEQGLVEHALAGLRRYGAASGESLAVLVGLEAELLARLSRADEARALVDAAGRALRPRIGLAIGELALDDPAEYARSREHYESDVARAEREDVFFAATTVGPLLEVGVELALLERDGALAVARARRALLDRTDARNRQRLAVDLVQGLATDGVELDARARGLALLAAAWRLTPQVLDVQSALAPTLRAWLAAGDEPADAKLAAARRHLAGRGSGEERVLEELERLAARAR